eukprot:3356536-Ditylum_brightwellii.AAC.2
MLECLGREITLHSNANGIIQCFKSHDEDVTAFSNPRNVEIRSYTPLHKAAPKKYMIIFTLGQEHAYTTFRKKEVCKE